MAASGAAAVARVRAQPIRSRHSCPCISRRILDRSSSPSGIKTFCSQNYALRSARVGKLCDTLSDKLTEYQAIQVAAREGLLEAIPVTRIGAEWRFMWGMPADTGSGRS